MVIDGTNGGVKVTAVLAAGLVAIACAGEVTLPRDEEPFLYLILNEQVVFGSDTLAQPALLLEQIRPDSVVYLTAENFEMRRVSDGASFGWRNEFLTRGDPFDLLQHPKPVDSNYLLTDSTSGSQLGIRSIEPGASYELRVDTKVGEIRGSVTIPDTFSVRLQRTDSGPRAVWQRVEGAAGYAVSGLPEAEMVLQEDTSIAVSQDHASVTVWALDPQAFRYVANPNAGQAGIEGGLGVFGAVQGARWKP